MKRTICTLCTLCTVLALAGCTTAPADTSPVFVTQDLPSIPDTCKGPWPPEPKLKAGQDADDLDAVKDRGSLKAWGRTQQHYRRSCLAELQAVLPDKGK